MKGFKAITTVMVPEDATHVSDITDVDCLHHEGIGFIFLKIVSENEVYFYSDGHDKWKPYPEDNELPEILTPINFSDDGFVALG